MKYAGAFIAACFLAMAAHAETPGREVAFSPNEGAEALAVKAIHSARQSIYLAAYSFTSKPIAQALVEAHRHGVTVVAVLDKSQERERYTGATFLANAGIPVRIDHKHPIMHDKFMVIDGHTVETGSFNYTKAAAEKNAENVLVLWDDPILAKEYRNNWQEHWGHSDQYR